MTSFNYFDGNAGKKSICPEVNASSCDFARHEEAIKEQDMNINLHKTNNTIIWRRERVLVSAQSKLTCKIKNRKRPQVFAITKHNICATGN